LEQFVDEGRLAMVNVSDDGDITDVLVHLGDVAREADGVGCSGKRVSLPSGRGRMQG
jgi:hypothetical protein